MANRVNSSDTTKVEGKVKALRVEHVDARDGIWVWFQRDGDDDARWYIDFLDQSALAVMGGLQILRDALLHDLRTAIWYTNESDYSERVIQQVRVYGP